MMVMTVGPRILPHFAGVRGIRSRNLMFATLLLLCAGCMLRVSMEPLAYEGLWPFAWNAYRTLNEPGSSVQTTSAHLTACWRLGHDCSYPLEARRLHLATAVRDDTLSGRLPIFPPLIFLFAFVAIERLSHDGLDRRHFSIRQLGKLALSTLAA